MREKFPFSRDTLSYISTEGGLDVYSYDTLCTKVCHKEKTVKELGKWSVTTTKHVRKVARHFGYTLIPYEQKALEELTN